tara:strand:- start:904 stop:1203 length:300 start_codon:yes stop_codon:yes gene_type:complete
VNIYWTHKKNFCGLKHFVLVSELYVGEKCFVLLVSVLDAKVNLTIPKEELEKSENWIIGWYNFNKSESITADYDYWLNKKDVKSNNDIFLDEGSPFNIT